MHVDALNVRERALPGALALGAWLLDAARDGHVHVAASVVRGPAVVLGQRQRAASVVAWDARGDVPVYRRATTGTAAYVAERAVVWSLALPRVNAVFEDATSATILNRNVRVFLRAFTRAGALSHYFGREWIAARHRPCALLGFDVTRDGRVLFEVIAGWEGPIELPAHLCSTRERALDRWRAKRPVALREVVGASWDATKLAEGVITEVAARVGEETFTVDDDPALAVGTVTRGDDPVPEGMVCEEPVAVPIGHVEVARGGGRVWLGGDALTATWWLDEAAGALARGEALPDGAVVEGARPEDWGGASIP